MQRNKETKKSELFSYRKKVRIFLVWWASGPQAEQGQQIKRSVILPPGVAFQYAELFFNMEGAVQAAVEGKFADKEDEP